MTVTEYVFIFYSFILALAVAEVLKGVGSMLRLRKASFSLIHMAWAGLVLLSIVQFWWSSWSLQALNRWTLPGMLTGFASTLLLYLAAFAGFPAEHQEDDEPEAYYFRESPTLWTLYALYTASAALASRVIFGQPWTFSVGDLVIAFAVALCVVAACSRRKWVHWLVISFFFVSGAAVVLATQLQIESP